jgi:hypothetical protein
LPCRKVGGVGRVLEQKLEDGLGVRTCGELLDRLPEVHALFATKGRDFLQDVASGSVWKSNLQPDFNVRVIERCGPDSFAVLRELDESDRFVQKSAESTSI